MKLSSSARLMWWIARLVGPRESSFLSSFGWSFASSTESSITAPVVTPQSSRFPSHGFFFAVHTLPIAVT